MMNKYKILICLLSSVFCLKGQTNLVPNPSFEQYSQCPDNQGQVPYANGWVEFGSADYFNACNTTVPDFSVPNNWGGFQNAYSGQAYCAIGTYLTHALLGSGIREYVGTSLSSPLTIGTKYYVSFNSSLALSSAIQMNCAANNLGALFSINQPNIFIPITSSFNPQVNNSGLNTDTVGWTRTFGSFVADSAYNNILIGNFFIDNNTDTLIMDGGTTCSSYYFIDEVCVSTDSAYCSQYTSGISSPNYNPAIIIWPNPIVNKLTIESNYFGNSYCELFDAIGHEVYSFSISPFDSKELDTFELTQGLYFLKVTQGSLSIIRKIQKQ